MTGRSRNENTQNKLLEPLNCSREAVLQEKWTWQQDAWGERRSTLGSWALPARAPSGAWRLCETEQLPGN